MHKLFRSVTWTHFRELLRLNDVYQIKYLNEIPKEKVLFDIINENKIILLKTESLNLE